MSSYFANVQCFTLLLLSIAPVTVQNVRVFVFFPHRDVTVAVAGKVVWDRLSQDGAGGTVDMYRIVLRDDNNQVPSMVRLAM